MRKHLLNLERLCIKLQALYGEQDPLVSQLRSEWNTHGHVQPPHHAAPWKLQHRRHAVTRHVEPQYRDL